MKNIFKAVLIFTAAIAFVLPAEARVKEVEAQTIEVKRDWVNADHYGVADEYRGWALEGEDFPFKDISQYIDGYSIVIEDSFAIRTNALYWLGGLANVGVEWRFSTKPKLGLILNAGYSPFSSDEWENNLGGWFVSPEARYYLGDTQNWFVGGQLLVGGANVRFPDYLDKYGREGLIFGVGVVGGYKLNLSGTFDMDFTLGVGYTHMSYDTYEMLEGGIKYVGYCNAYANYVLPIQLGVNLIWKL